MRFGENPRLRVQDGIKTKLLCSDCEKRLNQWETKFANNIFWPYSKDEASKFGYTDWLIKFCASVSWRTLRYYKMKVGLEKWPSTLQAQADSAEEAWRKVMFDEASHPGKHELHLLPLGPIESTTIEDLPNSINRYFLRGVEIDIAHNDETAFVNTKMGRFALFGIIAPSKNPWKGTRVAAREGRIEPRTYELPRELADYLADRARIHSRLHDEIPPHQAEKIEAQMLENLDRTRNSDQLKAMLADGQMFGREAITRRK